MTAPTFEELTPDPRWSGVHRWLLGAASAWGAMYVAVLAGGIFGGNPLLPFAPTGTAWGLTALGLPWVGLVAAAWILPRYRPTLRHVQLAPEGLRCSAGRFERTLPWTQVRFREPRHLELRDVGFWQTYALTDAQAGQVRAWKTRLEWSRVIRGRPLFGEESPLR